MYSLIDLPVLRLLPVTYVFLRMLRLRPSWTLVLFALCGNTGTFSIVSERWYGMNFDVIIKTKLPVASW